MLDKFKRFNFVSFFAMLALVAIGVLFVYSAGNARSEEVFHSMWRTHLTTAIVGLVVYLALSFIDYRKILDWFAIGIYAVSLLLLVTVLVVGSEKFGGRRWLWFFQPSEVAKLCVIVTVAHVFGRQLFEGIRGFRGFTLACALIGVPFALILLEPDLGTALVLALATLAMLFAAGVWRRGLLVLISAGALASAALLGAVYEAKKPGVTEERSKRILRYVPLKDHQVKRIKVFLFPESDLKGAAYTLRQSMISIGSGGLTGKGLGKGESNRLRYLPPSISMNDFIFCVYAGEWGFVGSLLLLALFGALLVPAAWTAYVVSDDRGRLLAIGISMLVFAHVFVNIAMSVGLVPITGVPLPFVSSGRTFLVTVMAGLGVIQSVSIHGREKSR